ncbi:hypothetical protein EJ06DRAFT_263823 [Trichodelitschia bisporula]|uniref:Uncharacterized protein n=1 Tax=Trichodelitschia bisporula TaxID=703511 RepID=A0A6G1HIQ8_9PEZI|nr:hypothetical protein EJ06DRAFT_263823 [Trichodelitschia bisporula]
MPHQVRMPTFGFGSRTNLSEDQDADWPSAESVVTERLTGRRSRASPAITIDGKSWNGGSQHSQSSQFPGTPRRSGHRDQEHGGGAFDTASGYKASAYSVASGSVSGKKASSTIRQEATSRRAPSHCSHSPPAPSHHLDLPFATLPAALQSRDRLQTPRSRPHNRSGHSRKHMDPAAAKQTKSSSERKNSSAHCTEEVIEYAADGTVRRKKTVTWM